MASRRALIRVMVATALGLGGCTSGGESRPQEADIIAGPNSRLRFDPETLTVPAGQQVTWSFDSSGHNVSGDPGDSDLVTIPDGAVPFSTYEEAEHRTMQQGETYSHQFDVPGTYQYVCIPHASAGMVGTIEVG